MRHPDVYHRKADALLVLSDSLAKTSPADSRRVLRQCRRYRELARDAEAEQAANNRPRSDRMAVGD